MVGSFVSSLVGWMVGWLGDWVAGWLGGWVVAWPLLGCLVAWFPVLLCTTKLAKSNSQYYFVLEGLHKESASQYYFVLPTLHKVLPSTTEVTTVYYKACTGHFPVLLCTIKLAQSPFQYYFVLQSLRKALPSNTLYYYLHKARSRTTLYYTPCTKYVPVLLCTTKLAQSTSQYYFVMQSLHKALPSTSSTRTRRGGSCLKDIYI